MTFSWPLLKKMLVFGLPEIPNQAGNWTLKTISQLILQHYWSVGAVAIFSVAFAIANILFELVISAIHWAVQPFYYQVGKEESREKAGEIFAYVATINMTVILFIGLFAILLGKELILIFASAKYAAAEAAIVILAVSAIFQFLYFIPSRVFYLQKRTAYLTPLLLLAVGLNLICGFLLIPAYGTIGAAWATLIAYAGRSLFALLLAQRVLFIPYDYRRLGKAVSVFTALVLARFLLPELAPLPEVALKLFLWALFPLLLYAVGFFQDREIQAARRLWREQVMTRLSRR
jgi:O-antigen/teichoic acid export membrane protein